MLCITHRPGFENRADVISAALNFTVCREGDSQPENISLALHIDEQGLSLQQLGSKASGPVRCDFAAGSARHRRIYGGGKNQDIAKAVGLNNSGFKPTVLDLTAGLGQDGFVLASLGAQITLVERHPIVHALLADGFERASIAAEQDDELQTVISRMQLVNANAADYLKELDQQSAPDIIYLDPMFPPREKSAKVKKEMQVFHQLVGENNDADELLPLAIEKARYRVVVKRPSYAPFLAEQEPAYSLKGKSTRFDIYSIKKLPIKKLPT